MNNKPPSHSNKPAIGSATLDRTYAMFVPDRMNVMRRLEPRTLLHIVRGGKGSGSGYSRIVHLSDGNGGTWLVPAYFLKTWTIFLN